MAILQVVKNGYLSDSLKYGVGSYSELGGSYLNYQNTFLHRKYIHSYVVTVKLGGFSPIALPFLLLAL